MDITYPTNSAPSRLAGSAKPAMTSSRQKDRQTQQLLEHDDVAVAKVLQIDCLLDCIAAARTNANMTLYYYVCVRSALVYVGLIDDQNHTLAGPMICRKQPGRFPTTPYIQLLSDTVSTLRGCAVFRAAAGYVNSRRPPNITFDHRRMVEVSCAVVDRPRVAPLLPLPLELRWCVIGLGHDGKKYTNALLQLLFCVPALRRLLRVDQPRQREMLRHLAALDAARDTLAVAALQRALLALFTDCCDNVADVLASVGCAYTFQTKTTVWCALHLGFDVAEHPQIALKCDAAVHQTIADAERGSRTRSIGHCEECDHAATLTVAVENMFNLRDGVLLVKPSPDHPPTVMDEQCGEWEVCGGILGDGRAFFRQGDHYYRHEPQQRLPCAFITPLKDESVERYCENQALHMLFYIRSGLHEGLETEAPLREVNEDCERDYLHCSVPQVLLPVPNCTGWYKSPQSVLRTPVSEQEHVLGDTRD
ncbi:hypothetical protein FN846DRAFT_902109 [Sphaerosporella brunnea]|uniref:Uncharacterized protein n=1 Tax=Sphaerosporella brunnea TaxID=1250544 RepID=A0A5J5FAS0_9PEZI|nr:hypothetical protein FN846DRAFT_902109 [Sphaerosporella brunnea]